MGRMGGVTSAMKKLAQKRAHQLGVPVRRVSSVGIAKASGLRTNVKDSRAKPGFVVKIGPSWKAKPGVKTAPTLSIALKKMKNVDPKYLRKLK